MMRYKFILMSLLFFGSMLNAISQDSGNFTKEEFETLSQEIDYSDTKQKLVLRNKKKLKNKVEDSEAQPPSFDWLRGFGSIFNLVAYLLIGILLIAIFYVLFKNVKLDKELGEFEIKEELDEETHIEELDLDTAFNRALEAGDYRLALRFKFLQVLQKLSADNTIDWKFEKTNRSYAQELRGTKFFDGFKEMAFVFEWVWYGNHDIDRVQFNQYMDLFSEFKRDSYDN